MWKMPSAFWLDNCFFSASFSIASYQQKMHCASNFSKEPANENKQSKSKQKHWYLFILDQTKLSVKQLTLCLPSSSTAFSYKAIGTAVTLNKHSVIILQGV